MVGQGPLIEASKHHRTSLGSHLHICKKVPLLLKGHASEGELSVDLMVTGKHAIMFDDDDAASFSNSSLSLLPWNGDEKLMIDRYDVRHLLQDLSNLRQRHATASSSDATHDDLNYERYRDLEGIDQEEAEIEGNVKRQKTSACSYQRVGFSYDVTCVSQTSPTKLDFAVYRPPFPVPKDLEAYLPPSQKVHKIIAGTAKFVSEHGGQSEIILRVKQAKNPAFGFLMPENRLHVYFRFLVDHPALAGAVPQIPGNSLTTYQSSEGLSMLGEIYGEDDEDDADGKASDMIQSSDDSNISSLIGDYGGISPDHNSIENPRKGKNDHCLKKEDPGLMGDHAFSSEAGIPGDASPVRGHSGSSQSELLEEATSSTNEMYTLEPPPSGMEVEACMLNNLETHDTVATDLSVPIVQVPHSQINKLAKSTSKGKEFEAVVQERDNVGGRVQCLRQLNGHHPYQLNILQQQEDMGSTAGRSPEISNPFKSTPVSSSLPKVGASTKMKPTLGQADPEVSDISGSADNKAGHGMSLDAAAALVRAATRGPLQFSLIKKVPKNVEGRTRQLHNDGNKQPCGMSLDAAAAAVMAATHGPWKDRKRSVKDKKLVDLGAFLDKSKLSIEALKCGVKSQILQSCCQENSQHSVDHESYLDQEDTIGKSVTKAAATTAVTAAYEADSGDARLTSEEKRKAERLKKAKLFAAMIQSGTHPFTKVERGSESNAVSTSLNSDQSDQAANSHGVQRAFLQGNSRKSSEDSQAGCAHSCDSQQGEVSLPISMNTLTESLEEKFGKGADKQRHHRRHHRHHSHHQGPGHRRKELDAEDVKEENNYLKQALDGVSCCDTDHVKDQVQKDCSFSTRKEKKAEGCEPPLQKGRGKRIQEVEDPKGQKWESGSYSHDNSTSSALSDGTDNVRLGREPRRHAKDSKNLVEKLVKYRHNENAFPRTEGVDTSVRKKKNEVAGGFSAMDKSSKHKSLSSEFANIKHESLAKKEAFTAAVVIDISDDLRAKVRAMLHQIH